VEGFLAWKEHIQGIVTGRWTPTADAVTSLRSSIGGIAASRERSTVRQVSLNLGGSVYDPNDPVGRLLFNVLAMEAEFESGLIRLRTREGIRSPNPRAISEASSPNSTTAKKHAWLHYLTLASTPSLIWRTSSEWPPPRSIEPLSEKGC
jgi:putative transposase